MNSAILNAQSMRLFLEGKREGKIDAYIGLCAEGLLDFEVAAERLNMPMEAFDMLYDLRCPPDKRRENEAPSEEGEEPMMEE